MAITVNITGGLVQLTGNPVEIKCSGGSAPGGSSGYKIMLTIISEDSKLEGAPFYDAITPDSGGEATFDISGIIDQPVKALFQYPASGFKIEYPTQAFNIQVQAGERYIDSNGDLQEVWGTVETDIIQMLKGGTNPRQISMMNDASTNFYEMYVEGDKFLTARPQGDMVHPTQFVKLWYMVEANKAAVTFNIKVVYDDATDSTYTSASFAMNKDNLYEFNCNPTLHGLDLGPAGKKAIYFQVWLNFGATTSQTRSFYLDWLHIDRPIFLFFANSLGGVDDIYFSGHIKDRFATEGKIGAYPYQTDDTVYDPTLIPSGKTGQNKWTLNTGFKSLTTMQYYRDFMLARQAWYLYSNLTQTTFNIIPVIIDGAEKLLVDRIENLFNMDINISEAHKSPFVFDNRSF